VRGRVERYASLATRLRGLSAFQVGRDFDQVVREAKPRLAGGIWEKETRESVPEILVVEQGADLGADVIPHIVATATMKCFDLGRDEQCRRDHAHVTSRDGECLGGLNRGRVPLVLLSRSRAAFCNGNAMRFPNPPWGIVS